MQMRKRTRRVTTEIGQFAPIGWIRARIAAIFDPFSRGVAALDRNDHAGAHALLRPLAEAGDRRAQTRLGLMYDEGLGRRQDLAQARAWFERAARQGESEACFCLGVMHHRARGVPQDLVQAHLWFARGAASAVSADQRQRLATARDRVAVEMTPDQLAAAEALARDAGYAPAAAASGIPGGA